MPGTIPSVKLTRSLVAMIFSESKFSNFVAADVVRLPLTKGRENLYVEPTIKPSSVAGKIIGLGSNSGGCPSCSNTSR